MWQFQALPGPSLEETIEEDVQSDHGSVRSRASSRASSKASSHASHGSRASDRQRRGTQLHPSSPANLLPPVSQICFFN